MLVARRCGAVIWHLEVSCGLLTMSQLDNFCILEVNARRIWNCCHGIGTTSPFKKATLLLRGWALMHTRILQCFNPCMSSAIRHSNMSSRLEVSCWKKEGRKATEMFHCIEVCITVFATTVCSLFGVSTNLWNFPLLTTNERQKRFLYKVRRFMSECQIV